MLDNPRAALMVLSSIVEPGDADLDDLIGEAGPVGAVEALWSGQVTERLARLSGATVAAGPDPARRAAALQEATEACGARVLIPGDADWPVRLCDLYRLGEDDDPHLRPPRCLWVRGEGDLAAVCRRSVAVVGARAASEYGKHIAGWLAADLAEAGHTVVSGGALGIDRAAHQGALGRGGSTVAVLPAGVDRPYPRANQAMFDLIVQRGLAVSEWPPGTAPARHRFLARMRVIAALTAGVVVVEAARRSGALHTAEYAARLGRVVMFTPGPVTSSLSEGVHRLARQHRGARLVTRAEEVIEDLTGRTDSTRSQPADVTPFEALTAVEQWLVEAMPRGFIAEDTRLAAAAGVPVDAATEALQRLQHRGWIEQINDGRWRLRAVTGS
ncbi:DNA-processing protein DprA [Glycomyces arizonensis]|uniref:DNA-processing protein DprA n=1 Tax=Glycomyces arizonensis TaxID=256035 RepID=UPI000555D6FB|nr:DNA-processing protein DprA [Glycomyces arizonensis]